MSEESEKSEQPSQHKLDEARKNGQVDKNSELAFFAGALAFVAVVAVSFQHTAYEVVREFYRMFSLHDFILSSASFYLLTQDVFHTVLKILLPILLLILVCSILVQIAYSGLVWSAKPLQFDFTKLNPVSGFKKLFARKMWFDLLKNTLKIALIAAGFYLAFPFFFSELRHFQHYENTELAGQWLGISVQLVLFLLLLLLPFLLIDLGFSRWNFLRQMRMSKREVKDEYKKREGDPQVKSKQKQIQRELLKRSGSLANVKNADIVVVNPVHIAVALQFEASKMHSPQIVSAGKGEFAARIKIQARQHGVPIVQNKALARMLYRDCQIGGYVPVDAFKLLVPLYRWLAELKTAKGAV